MKKVFLFRLFPPLRILWLLVLGATLSLGTASCDDDDDDTPTTPAAQNVVQVAQSNPDFSTLVAAVVKADLATTLSGAGPFTVFAPNNAAFAKLAGGPLDAFSTAAKINAVTDASQIAALRGVLLYHVVGANIKAADIAAGASSRTTARPASAGGVNDNTLYLTKAGTSVFLNGSTRVLTADLGASNGTIHAIDNVLLPPSQSIAAIVAASAAANPPQFSLLLQALSRPAAASLLTAASANTSNITVFAPTNAAFQAALTALNLQNVSQIPDATLVGILQKHIIGTGRVFSSDLAPGTATTLNGNVTIAAAGSGFTVRGGTGTAANITTANILATNGVIHVIDQVLLP
ncbi:Uncaracterized surface protein containing fasciclin (FAS1) repeats [Hymenobacter daecheongensis DSM 21074]|uniref:Uncaracterized surface protein containing fasciclin (FAS1) repeats n=1 Tax=Hymenobacter daecheongensis DSM 21074 TaxID=1121955 RepID=A0A1M6KW56_9BACT|nr:fasciclin domain-containing protein [Hymenobacter daecheongensis]SHJ63104.1 Uncaracterized surface protein containing fasciclin (FAS1) repeats [Hymenobacter daecheongensis DSM 21074]